MKNRFNKLEITCILIFITAAVACFAGYFLHIYLEEPTLKIKGNKEITLELKEEYKEPGYIATLSEKDITKDVKVTGKVDTTQIGDYTLTYSVTNTKGKKEATLYRTVKVRDKVNPVIKLKGNATTTINYGSTYKEPGYKATDNYDGDITKNVKITGKVNTKKLGSYQLTYNITDSSENVATTTRTVKVVDLEKPTITLQGKQRMVIKVGATYTEPGCTATDNYDGNITENITVSGKINTNKAGIYEKIYTVKDSSGNYTSITRIVQVGAQTDIDESTYIMISIKEQHLWYYQNGKLKLSTDIVSGKKGVWDTLTGRFRITNKVAGTYLVGADYRCWVDYWMLFDYRSQSGLHDATWLNKFGGDVYKTKGSHGCVNMPYNQAKALFNSVSLGTLVIIY